MLQVTQVGGNQSMGLQGNRVPLYWNTVALMIQNKSHCFLNHQRHCVWVCRHPAPHGLVYLAPVGWLHSPGLQR